MQKSSALIEFLKEHEKKKTISFHMPGHKGQAFFQEYGYDIFLNEISNKDITEIPGADNLFQSEGILKEVAIKYSKLYDVKKSYLLINGTSSGIIASILAICKKGEKLIVARNCHKSVFSGLSLGNITPIYIHENLEDTFKISGEIDPLEVERTISENRDAKGVILPSPNYYGICSNIKEISDIVHRAGMVLIVDQAHGAHLKFTSKSFLCGEESGADIVINSTHKTLASFTQSAILNLNSDRISEYELEEKLQFIQSTSPSYILMASLDINADILKDHGEKIFKTLECNLKNFYKSLENEKEIRLLYDTKLLDYTKININMGAYGIDGLKLEKLLLREGIVPELNTGDILMCMTGIGTTKKHLDMLRDVLIKISREYKVIDNYVEKEFILPRNGQMKELGINKELISIKDAKGRVCASSIIPYPPGIPLICPGECITEEAIEYALKLRNEKQKVVGMDPNSRICVFVQ